MCTMRRSEALRYHLQPPRCCWKLQCTLPPYAPCPACPYNMERRLSDPFIAGLAKRSAGIRGAYHVLTTCASPSWVRLGAWMPAKAKNTSAAFAWKAKRSPSDLRQLQPTFHKAQIIAGQEPQGTGCVLMVIRASLRHLERHRRHKWPRRGQSGRQSKSLSGPFRLMCMLCSRAQIYSRPVPGIANTFLLRRRVLSYKVAYIS